MVRIFSLILLLASPSFAANAPEPKPIPRPQIPDLSGHWVQLGQYQDGSLGLTGYVLIQNQKGAYILEFFNRGGAGHGIGILIGNKFNVGWRDGPQTGIAVYDLDCTGNKIKLIGKWFSDHHLPGGEERLEFLKGL